MGSLEVDWKRAASSPQEGGMPTADAPTPYVELLARMRAGDPIAMHQFYRRVEPFLRTVARRWLSPSVRRQMDSTDVAESVFRRVLGGHMRARFADEARLLAWMATIVRNRIRTASRRVHAPGGAAWSSLVLAEDLAALVPEPEAWAANAEEVRVFMAAIEHLPPDERSVVTLRDFEGLSFQEVADALDRPSAEAARKLHGRALQRLRTALHASQARDDA